MTIYDAMEAIPDEPGKALAEWCAQAPATGYERAVREDLARFMATSRSLREAWLDLQQALSDAAKKLQVSSADSAEGHHADPWLDGYRVGVGHAEVRIAAFLHEMAALMRIRAQGGGS